MRTPRARTTSVAWAIATWSKVTQKRKGKPDVKRRVLEVGWRYFVEELLYWLEQTKPPGDRNHAPHPGWPPPPNPDL